MPPTPAEAQDCLPDRPTRSEPAPSNHFYIRDFEAGDTQAVHAMFAAAQSEYGNSMDYVRHAIEHDLSDATAHYVKAPRSAFFCAVDSATQQLLGIVGIRPLQVGDTDYYNECVAAIAAAHGPTSEVPFVPDTTAELNRMAVAPHARRRGVARSLVHRCLAFCHSQHYTHLHLSTLVTMRQAVAFYTSCGLRRYRTDRQNWKDDERIGTEEMQRVYVQRGEREEDKTKCWIADDEIPTDEAVVTEMRDRGIYMQCHFIIAVNKQTVAQASSAAPANTTT